MNTPNKHADIIKAWADGAEIECRHSDTGWSSNDSPKWLDNYEYRIKERTFPETNLSTPYLFDVWFNAKGMGGSLTAVANAAIKQYILDLEK